MSRAQAVGQPGEDGGLEAAAGRGWVRPLRQPLPRRALSQPTARDLPSFSGKRNLLNVF